MSELLKKFNRNQFKNTLLFLMLFIAVFLATSYFFRLRNSQEDTPTKNVVAVDSPAILLSIINSEFPAYRLINSDQKELTSKELKQGKIILIFVAPECKFCRDEAKFLAARINMRKDIHFIGIDPFGYSDQSHKVNEVFPFDVYLNPDGKLREQLNLQAVPVKLFLQNGVVKKIMSGSTTAQRKEEEFDEWLASIEK